MITGTVAIDLSRTDNGMASEVARQDRRRLVALERCPDGAHVVIDVGGRSWLYEDALAMLRRHGDRLSIELVGAEPAMLAELVPAARRGGLGVAS